MTKRAKIKPKQEEIIKNPYNNGVRQTKDILTSKGNNRHKTDENGFSSRW
jgi:hypothetical protein